MKLLWPIRGIGMIPGIWISQLFGVNAQNYPGFKGHMGIDIACPTDTPVYAAHAGNLQFGTNPNGYGTYIYNVSSDNTFLTIYGHLHRYEGLPRDVKQGDLIAYSNNTGNSTGPHLHFGLQPIPANFNNGYGGDIDPLPFLEGANMSQIKTQNYKGELRIVLGVSTVDQWAAICAIYGVDPQKIDENIPQ